MKIKILKLIMKIHFIYTQFENNNQAIVNF